MVKNRPSGGANSCHDPLSRKMDCMTGCSRMLIDSENVSVGVRVDAIVQDLVSVPVLDVRPDQREPGGEISVPGVQVTVLVPVFPRIQPAVMVPVLVDVIEPCVAIPVLPRIECAVVVGILPEEIEVAVAVDVFPRGPLAPRHDAERCRH